jgi:hypothetical protein
MHIQQYIVLLTISSTAFHAFDFPKLAPKALQPAGCAISSRGIEWPPESHIPEGAVETAPQVSQTYFASGSFMD